MSAFGGGHNVGGGQGVKDGDPIAWMIFIIMGAILIFWLASGNSPFSNYPAFNNNSTSCVSGHINPCGTPIHNLQTAFAEFAKPSILTGIMILVVPLGLGMFAEYIFKLGMEGEDNSPFGLANQDFTYLRKRARTYTRALRGKTYYVSAEEYDKLPKSIKRNPRNRFVVKQKKKSVSG